MIEISGRSASVPEDERLLGFTGDNDCEVRVISLKNESLSACAFKIDVCGADGTRNILEPEKSTEGGEILLTWVIKKEHIRQSGALFAQVRAFDENGMVWHSDIFEFEVCGSIEASEAFADAVPSEFEEIEKAVTAAKTSAEEAAAAAEDTPDNADAAVARLRAERHRQPKPPRKERRRRQQRKRPLQENQPRRQKRRRTAQRKLWRGMQRKRISRNTRQET